jgi:hypothetical protein
VCQSVELRRAPSALKNCRLGILRSLEDMSSLFSVASLARDGFHNGRGSPFFRLYRGVSQYKSFKLYRNG